VIHRAGFSFRRKLTARQQITPYKWVHPNEERQEIDLSRRWKPLVVMR
jgi:hypothetical protein